MLNFRKTKLPILKKKQKNSSLFMNGFFPDDFQHCRPPEQESPAPPFRGALAPAAATPLF
jgi:hypothetical protein